jgi:hypothetical protein
MRAPTSWTRQQAILHCPRRFHFRYLSQDSRVSGLKRLSSVRELGGHVIHTELAGAVRRIADGERISDQTDLVQNSLKEFDAIVARSMALRPGVLHGGLQLAETFNGINCTEQIRDWREIIATSVENGVRMCHYFSFRANRPGYHLEAEHRARFQKRGREHSFVLDVIIDDATVGTSIIDWKTHDISVRDFGQIDTYQDYLLHYRQISPTRLYGFLVDLLHGSVKERHYRPIERLTSTHAAPHTPLRVEMIPPGLKPDPYPARPGLPACSICSFSTICSDSAIKHAEQEVVCER